MQRLKQKKEVNDCVVLVEILANSLITYHEIF
jgi:hypothetical protein